MPTILTIARPKLSLLDRVNRSLCDLEDRWFEKKNGLDLSGYIPITDMVTSHNEALKHANPYQATWCKTIRILLHEAKKTGIKFENFIDIGSGKGKACFYASTQMPFVNIIGIEFSMPLIDVAKQNLKIFNEENIHFYEEDAGKYLLPNANNLVFLFNSFDGELLSMFIKNNIDHFRKYETLIAYSNDTERTTLTKLEFETIFRDQTRKMSIFQFLR